MIQLLLGHAQLSSSGRYTHVVSKTRAFSATNLIARTRSPLDDLEARAKSQSE